MQPIFKAVHLQILAFDPYKLHYMSYLLYDVASESHAFNFCNTVVDQIYKLRRHGP